MGINGSFKVASAVIALCMATSCTTIEKKQDEAAIGGIVHKAYKSGKPVYVKVQYDKTPYITKILSDSPSIIFSKNPAEEQSINYIECISLLDPGNMLYYPVFIKTTNEEGTSTKALLVTGIINGIKGSTVSLAPDINYEVILIDKSKMIGQVTLVDLDNNVIGLSTKLTTLRIPTDKIASMGEADLRDVVEVILIDGTQRKGFLESDDGKFIILDTILGKEKYSRDKVLKINYKNKK